MVSLGKRLRRWLRGASAASDEVYGRDYLPGPMSPELLLSAVGGAGTRTRPTEIADALLAVSGDRDASLRAAVASALGSVTASRWLALDTALRNRWWHAPRWSRTLAADLADGEVDVLRLLVAAGHYSGRIRQAAVIRMADQTDPAVVAVLALRACDWADEVRKSARDVIVGWPSPPGGAALVSLAAMAFALQGRREGTWLIGRVESLLQNMSAEQLEPLLTAGDRRVRRAAYQLAIASGKLNGDRLLSVAAKDPDLPVRIICARAAILAAPSPPALRGLLSSPSALVRAEALRALAAVGNLSEAKAALADRHPMVRLTAQGAVRHAGLEPAACYRQLMTSSWPQPGTIAGLGETGVAEDADLIAPNLSHPRSRGRVEAIRALRRLGVSRVEELIPLLTDGSGAVTRQVVATLRHHVASLDPTMVEALLNRGNPSHVRFAGYQLLVASNTWQRLITNLRLIRDEDDRLRGNSRSDISHWLEREAATAYSSPDRRQASELESLIESARPVLDKYKIQLLRFHIGTS